MKNKKFNKFFPELLKNPEIYLAVKVLSIHGDPKEECYTKFLTDASSWIKNQFAKILEVSPNHGQVIEAESAKNLSILFDTLQIKTWASNCRTPQPTADKTKAGIVKVFLYVLDKNDYDIHPVLERYLGHEKKQDHVSRFKEYLDSIGEGEMFNDYLSRKDEMFMGKNDEFSAAINVPSYESSMGYGKTKDAARQNACDMFFQKNGIVF